MLSIIFVVVLMVITIIILRYQALCWLLGARSWIRQWHYLNWGGFASKPCLIKSSRLPCGLIPTSPWIILNHTWMANKNEQTTRRHHLITFQLETITKSDNAKCWRGYGSIGSLYMCWRWDCKLLHSHGLPGDMCKNVQSSGKLGTTLTSSDRRINTYGT